MCLKVLISGKCVFYFCRSAPETARAPNGNSKVNCDGGHGGATNSHTLHTYLHTYTGLANIVRRPRTMCGPHPGPSLNLETEVTHH